ncbi:ArsR/SmtB family transcription factor [Lentzea atacamensis]|uniref:ArsR/SmtB family transcription factor n=1 Tax=Lentzea atacamensis TaxID=531938 RepID=UPI001476173B|nr:metalloregulator ArsR/SmtB family transcription factor [Lentzea atacamensis]
MVEPRGELQVDDGGRERCVSLGQGMDLAEARRVAEVFKALASPPRLALLRLLQVAPGGESCVCDLVDRLGLSQGTVSHHLRVLADAGLVRGERRGTWGWYVAVPEGLDQVRRLLGQPVAAT